jgi:hypothetical protein
MAAELQSTAGREDHDEVVHSPAQMLGRQKQHTGM